MRKGFCFDKFDENGCTIPKARQMTKSVCCCTMGAGWGDPCELCPRQNTCKILTCYSIVLHGVLWNILQKTHFHNAAKSGVKSDYSIKFLLFWNHYKMTSATREESAHILCKSLKQVHVFRRNNKV